MGYSSTSSVMTAKFDSMQEPNVVRRVGGGYANVAEIAGTVARRDVHAAAEGRGEMGKVPPAAGFAVFVALRLEWCYYDQPSWLILALSRRVA
jgi:hypothetical protein